MKLGTVGTCAAAVLVTLSVSSFWPVAAEGCVVVKRNAAPGRFVNLADGSAEPLFIVMPLGGETKKEQEPEQAPATGQKEGAGRTALLKARVDAARKAYGAAREALEQSKRIDGSILLVGKPEEVYTWSVRWLSGQQDMSAKKEDRVAALEDHLKRMKELQHRVTKQNQGGLVSSVEIAATAWYVAEAELCLAKEKAK
jgi:hypothetical protein